MEKLKDQPIEANPIIHSMKACIVGMEYSETIKKDDGTPKLDLLGESYSDVAKVKKLLEETLGWESYDIETFKDSKLGIMKVYDKINQHIQDLKTLAKHNKNPLKY